MENQELERHTGFFQSATARMIMVGLLTLVLLIPLEFVKGLIDERAQRQDEVIAEINDKWGESIYFYGPVIKIPYKTYTESVSLFGKNKEAVTQRTVHTNYAFFFPEVLNTKANVDTKVRKRSNYESVVFTSVMNFDGSYSKPDFSIKNIPDSDVLWNKATVVIRTGNLKSIRDEVRMNLGGKSYSFEPVFTNERDSVQALETGYIDASAFGDLYLSIKPAP